METKVTSQTPSDPSALPVVALVGRPNVGKSALFNRLVGRRQALVEEVPGTTRDRVYADVVTDDGRFTLVDTGGLGPAPESGFSELIRGQVEQAIAHASVLLFVVDAKAGVIAADEEVAELLRRAGKPIFLLANKVDNEARGEDAVQFYQLGFGEPMLVSAQHGTGVLDVMDRILEALPALSEEAVAGAPRIAIVGRPNVGKSMLLNSILGEDRVIVSDIPGTTRDAVDSSFEFAGRSLVLVDTAGLRRPGRVHEAVEHHATLRARHALERADTAFIVFDATEGMTAQDLHVIGFALKAKTGVVAVANKWDLMAGKSLADFERDVRHRLRFASWASLRLISAKESTGIHPLLAEGLRLSDLRTQHIETGRLNAVVQRAVADRPPSMVKNQQLKLYYVTQMRGAPPTFVFFVNKAALVHYSYRRYLENIIRRAFGFEGVTLDLKFRSRKEP